MEPQKERKLEPQKEEKNEEQNEEQQKEGYYPFRFRSTGLGNTLLEGEPAEIVIVDDVLVMHIQTTSPVRWRIRAGLTFKGLLKSIKLALKWSVIKFLLRGVFTLKHPRLPTEF